MIKTVKWNGKELHVVEWLFNNELEWMFLGSEVVEALEYKLDSKTTYTKYINRHCTEKECLKVKKKELKGYLKSESLTYIGRLGDILLTKNGVLQLLSNCNTISYDTKMDFINTVFQNENIALVNYFCESNFISGLEELIKQYFTSKKGEDLSKDFLGIRQYKIDNYKIDYYIPCIRLAIEYDEGYHKYEVCKDDIRQKYIEDKLKCEFLRVDNKNDIVNVNLMFNVIINKLKKEYYF